MNTPVNFLQVAESTWLETYLSEIEPTTPGPSSEGNVKMTAQEPGTPSGEQPEEQSKQGARTGSDLVPQLCGPCYGSGLVKELRPVRARDGRRAHQRRCRVRCTQCKGKGWLWGLPSCKTPEKKATDNEDQTISMRDGPCIACYEITTDSEPSTKITASCSHSRHTCSSCLRSWITGQLTETTWDKIQCPECTQTLQYADVYRHSTKDIFQRYDELATKAALSANPDYRSCLNPECTSGQIHPGGIAEPIFRCGSCGFKTCVLHNKPWHEGETCEEYSKRQKRASDDDKASTEQVKKIAKACPGCDRPIQKNMGCDHMTCSSCKHEFCYSCLADYKKIRKQGNSAHEESCGYHTRNISSPPAPPWYL